MYYIDVSVIIPYYRSHNTIERAVNSILNQSLLPKKIFIIDDFSETDKDKIMLEKLSENKLIEIIGLAENSGPGIARNAGIKKTDTKYIAFLDSDDSWHEKKLEVQFNVMEKYNTDISTHRTAIFKGIYPQIENDIENVKIKKINKYIHLFKNQFSTRSVMLKKDDQFLFSDKRRAEDYLLWSQILINGKKAIKIEETLAFSYKNNFGESGLTKSLSKIFFAGVHADYLLLKNKEISLFLFLVLLFVKSLKFIIRYIKFLFRR